jgi:predicted RNase H-like HicB family nuclease
MDKRKKIRSEDTMAKIRRVFPLRGYTKPEGDGFVAICVDLDIVAQGKTLKEATQICSELIEEYIAFVLENYPDKIQQYIPRLAPEEIVAEYNGLVGECVKNAQKVRQHQSKPKAKVPAGGIMNCLFDFERGTSSVCPA